MIFALDGYVIAIGVLSFLMAFSIGANDAANALATSYGSNALSLIWLVLLGSVFEFIGAYFCSGHVAGQLVNNIISDVDSIDDLLVEKMMLGASISSFVFIMSSSLFGMPISGTHTVVGALIGSGLAVTGGQSINWSKLGMIIGSWFVAPLVSIILCALFFVAVCRLTLNQTRNQFQAKLMWLIVFTGIAFTIICFMFIKLIKEKNTDLTKAEIICLCISPVIGIFLARLILFILVKPKRSSLGQALAAIFCLWTTENLENLLNHQCNE